MGKIDPIMLEVMKNAFFSITEEMGVALVRTAYSTNIKDRKDCSCALYTHEGNLISQGLHIPGHLGVLPLTVKNALKRIPMSELEPGDAIIYNDPYIGNTHTPDIVAFAPIFYNGEPVAVVANMAHHIDVGGTVPGSLPTQATDIFQEGLRLPPVKIRKRGVLDTEIMKIFESNTRTPYESQGDLRGQIGANNVGEKRFIELCNRFGIDLIRDSIRELEAYCERMMRAELEKIPRGVFEFEDYVEGDGITADMIRLKVRVEPKGDHITIDWTGTEKQARGPVNAMRPVVLASTYYVIKCITDPSIPPNEGTYRPIEVITPKGTVVNPEFPSPTGQAGLVTGQRVIDTLLGCFSKCVPEKISAAAVGAMNFLALGGHDPRTGQYFSNVETYGGGYGAAFDQDGEDAIQTHRTNTKNCPVEIIEAIYPMRVDAYGIVTNSEGAGEFRGGMGVTREYLFDTNVSFMLATDRTKLDPWGLFGGMPPSKGEYYLVQRDGTRKEIEAKSQFDIFAGEKFVLRTRGGGGWGNPLQRDPEKVAWDVLEGLVSLERARGVYGVVLEKETMKVDLEKTARLRKKRGGKQTPSTGA